MKMIFQPQAPVLLPIHGTKELFPARRIYCIGRNYAAHSREMGGDPTRETPFFFMKPIEALVSVTDNKVHPLAYPTKTSNYHFEAEMVVCLHKGGKDIALKDALDHVYGYAVGVDMTRRDLQDEAKAARRPWEAGKGGDYGAPLSAISPVSLNGHVNAGLIELKIDGVTKQKSDVNHMIWTVEEQIHVLSQYFELFPGDIIFTGTPDGVGKVERGQTMSCAIEKLGEINFKLV
jgi:fumarylpyruvate hydrolase